MQRYKAIIAYDGTEFFGYQVQPKGRTVQAELEAALAKIHKGVSVKVTASGRTDAGVHAKGQVIHFDSPLAIPEDRWGVAFNSLLPEDLAVLSVKKADNAFHARFDAAGKEYRYQLQLSGFRDPFQRNYVYRYPYALNLETMREASRYLLGTHDFTSFCAAKTEVQDKVRTIKEIDFLLDGNLLTIRFVGNGFLYNMVRILVGTLLAVGSGDLSPEEIPSILEKKDRSAAGKTAPARGLYLWEVFY
ncbi:MULTISPECIES: tRNA pseudouridine(38-40) synthase TruA [Neobacillus]|uniref:tRNA pseudouridine synthase A n=1 Tax=Neobacillus rhizophilus TaxID=2833579 RepID=A0A942UG09_9BACI|nr:MULTISPECIES: tRNA pseudouridine(38-40) synthase TruA [Neobacillus]MBS4216534.1 tRNA pseudouridine(38-40) synthase TruA [Neobacillus rhizophilus]MBU8919677.1 tRNA pseudouridine(38-40) synthase TruA [Bacillus sp. FJAT-29953]